MSTEEKLKKRDLTYHIHRRTYGRLLVAEDIDMIDFDLNDKPVLVQELKHGNVNVIRLADLTKFRNVANALEVPFMITVYFCLKNKNGSLYPIHAGEDIVPDHVQYYCYTPDNLLVPQPTMLTEQEYVDLLYRVRGFCPVQNLKFCNSLHDNINPPEIK